VALAKLIEGFLKRLFVHRTSLKGNFGDPITRGRSVGVFKLDTYMSARTHTIDRDASDSSRMRFYCPVALGKTQFETPEGFLVIHDVPIARIGEMLYADGEIPLEASKDGLIRISREADEVFHPNTIASFMGKPVTNDHPPMDVTPLNWREYDVGTVMNVRRGENPLDDFLLADLFIKDPDAIDAVKSGKREVSCGYDADYEQTDIGRGKQLNIIGNHVALVDKGRCGPRCAIGDQQMSTKVKVKPKTWKDRVLSAFKARDEEGLAEALESVEEASEDGDDTTHRVVIEVKAPEAAVTDEEEPAAVGGEDPVKMLAAAVNQINERLAKIEEGVAKNAAAEAAETADEDPDEGKEKKDDESGKTSDGMRTVFQDAVARAEILVPGIKLPTFDAKQSAKKTTDSICALRRKALATAHANDAMKPHLAPFLDAGGQPDFSKMTCDAVKMIFNGASELAKVSNNRTTDAKPPLTGDAHMRDTVKSMNKRNSEFWKR